MLNKFSSGLMILFLVVGFCAADEGQWPPDELSLLPIDELQKRGLRLKPEDLWSDRGTGLLSAAVDLDGCSSGFVSSEGLILTNYHCAFDAVQQASTVEKNYVRDGFLAQSRKEELPARAGTRALILLKILDVTDRVIGPSSKAAAAKQDAERYNAVEKARKEIVAECEKTAGRRCNVHSFYDGLQYKLHEMLELKDVRIVYSPPRGVGEYGGEVDNWQWPRHTGDFAILRAYASPSGSPADYSQENIPYKPRSFFKVSREGADAGDLVLIAGYPGKTNRFLTSSGVKDYLEWFYPLRARIYREWINILEEAGKSDPDVALRASALIKTNANREKNARGQIAGIKRNQVLEKTIEQEINLEVQDPEVLEAVEKVLAATRITRDRDFYLSELPRASNYLGSAMTAVRFAKERRKPDLERYAGYQDRDLDPAIQKELDRDKTLAPQAERKVLLFLLKNIRELTDEQMIKAFKSVTADEAGSWISKMDAETKLSDKSVRVANLKASLEELKASSDPYLRLALLLDEDVEDKIRREKENLGALLKVRPPYLQALKKLRGTTYPDANSSLRLSVAEIKGYSPQEGIRMEPETTLKGVLAKHTGETPFDLPEKVLQKALQERNTIRVCSLSNGDTTGGSSGSPVLDGEGRLVGINFDRVWENIAGDFGWSPTYSRNIFVDVRYVLWILENVENASDLVRELTN